MMNIGKSGRSENWEAAVGGWSQEGGKDIGASRSYTGKKKSHVVLSLSF